MYRGNLTEDATLHFKFTSRQATGAPHTLAGSPELSVYKANNTAESTAGVTLSVDFDSRTGCNHVTIDTSADAFYAPSNDYQVVITAGTVNGVSVVGEVVAEFSIENRFAEVDATKLAGSTTAATKLAASANRIVSGTVDTVVNGHTPTVNQFQADNITEATPDHYVGREVVFSSGALTDQRAVILSYSQVGGIGQFTVTTLTEAPANNDTFEIH